MDTDTLLLIVVAITALAAAFFTVVPVLPGSLLVPVGAVACGLIGGWDGLAWWFWVAQGVLVGAGFAVDQIVQAIGVQRAGGSTHAMWGGAIGVFVGPFALAFVMGPFALLLGPPIGSVVGTILGQELGRWRTTVTTDRPRDYRRLGLVVLVAYAVGTGIKLVLVAFQVGLLLVGVSP